MHFAVFNEDKPDHTELRMATREEHLAYMGGFDIRIGGPIKNEAGDMIGSCIVVQLGSLAEAEAFVANDPYTKAGLFERTRVVEFLPAIWQETPS